MRRAACSRRRQETAAARESLVGVFNRTCLINYDNYRHYSPPGRWRRVGRSGRGTEPDSGSELPQCWRVALTLIMTYDVVMKTMNIAHLKAHLSSALREVAAGETILVMDRSRPVAELGPVSGADDDVWQRLARTRGVRLGTQNRAGLKFSRVAKRIDIVALARDVQRDAL